MTYCENCMHSEICKYQRTVEIIDGNLSSYTKTCDIPDILKIQLKCEKFTKKTSPFTCRNDAGELIKEGKISDYLGRVQGSKN